MYSTRHHRISLRLTPFVLALLALATTAAQAQAQEATSDEGEPKTALEEAIHALSTDEEMIVVGRRLWPLGIGPGPVIDLRTSGSHDVVPPIRVRDIPPWSVEEVVNQLPGVSSRLYSGDEHLRPSIAARGIPDNGFTEYVGVHVDGINYSTLFYGWTALSIFPFSPERIYAAEVHRGAHAIRYGPTTLGGAVNLITHPIPDRWTIWERISAGDDGFFSSTTQVGGTGEDGIGFLLTHVEKFGDTHRDNSEFELRDTAIKTHIPLGPATYLEFNGFHWRDEHELPVRLTKEQFEADPLQNPNHPDADWAGWAWGGDATVHHDFGDRNWAELQTYYRKARRSLKGARPRGGPFTSLRSADSDNYNQGFYARGEFVFDAGVEHVAHWGVRAHNEWIYRKTFTRALSGGGRTDLSDTRTKTQATSLHIDDTVKLDDLTLNLGLRHERINRSRAEDQISGNSRSFSFDDTFAGASASWALSEHVAAFGNYHQTFRAPQTWAYDFSNKAQDFTFEQGEMRELGVRLQDWSGVSGSVVVWESELSDFIDYDDITDVFTNLGAFESSGLDLTVELDVGRHVESLEGLSLFHSQTWQESTFASGDFDGHDVQHTPPVIATGGVRWAPSSTGFYGTMTYNYRAKSQATPENDVQSPSYMLWDARIGYRTTTATADGRKIDFDIAIAAKNLFDRDHHLRHNADYFVPGRPRALFLDLGISCEF